MWNLIRSRWQSAGLGTGWRFVAWAASRFCPASSATPLAYSPSCCARVSIHAATAAAKYSTALGASANDPDRTQCELGEEREDAVDRVSKEKPATFERALAGRGWAGVLTLILALFAAPCLAQPNIVAQVKADLQARGVDLSGPCGAFAITARVAWTLRSTGAGLLDKPAGNNCQGRAVDILIYPDGTAFDILADSGGANGPSWNPIAPIDSDRWRAPVDPTHSPTNPPGPPPPAGPDGSGSAGSGSPPAPVLYPSFDLTPILAQLQAIYDQNERIYADLTHRLEARPIVASPITVPDPVVPQLSSGSPAGAIAVFVVKYVLPAALAYVGGTKK
jgi:hypothetical protein